MSVDFDVEFARGGADVLNEPGRANDDLAEREPCFNSILVPPALDQRDIAVKRLVRGHEHGLRHRRADGLALVDGGQRHETTHAHFKCGLAHAVRVRAAGLGETGGADAQEICIGDETREIHILGIEACLERNQVVLPNRQLQFALASDLSELAPQQLLRGVQVRVDQPRNCDPVPSVDGGIAPIMGGRIGGGAHPDDASAVDRYGAVAEDGVVFVERDNIAASDHDIDIGPRLRISH